MWKGKVRDIGVGRLGWYCLDGVCSAGSVG